MGAIKKISEGAEAKVYREEVFGKSLIIKTRMPKPYRQKELDEEIRFSRTRSEARIIGMVNEMKICAPILVAAGKYTIIMSEVKGTRMSSAKNLKNDFFSSIGMMLAALHSADISHGDFTPANIIVNNGRPCIIDFGLSEITKSIEEKAIDLLLMKRSISEAEYAVMEKSYAASYRAAGEVIRRLATIERRGRYQTRTLNAADESS